MVFNVRFLEQFTESYFNKISLIGFSFEQGVTQEMDGLPYAIARYYLVSHEKRYELVASSVLRGPMDVNVGIEINEVRDFTVPEEGLYRILRGSEKAEVTFERVQLSDMLQKYKVPVPFYIAHGQALDCNLFGVTLECETPEFAGVFDDDNNFIETSKENLEKILCKY